MGTDERAERLRVYAGRAKAAQEVAKDAVQTFAREVAEADAEGMGPPAIVKASGYSRSYIHRLILTGADRRQDEIEQEREGK